MFFKMCSMEVKKLLKSCGLEKYVNIFEANRIDSFSLPLLTFDTLSTLIPPIGERIKFLHEVTELQNKLEVVVDSEHERQAFNIAADDPLLNAIPKPLTDPEPVEIIIANPVPVGNSNPVPIDIDVSEDNIVQEYLKSTKGERIKANYFGPETNLKPPEKQYLDEYHQSLLVELIIDNELKTASTEISTSRLKQLAQFIEQIFPNEKQGIYYVPYSSVRINGKVIKKNGAKGKLWWKYTNSCKTLRRDGVRLSTRKIISVPSSSNQYTVGLESVNGYLLWLEGQREITETVKQRWKETSKQRLNMLLDDQIQCGTIIRRSGQCLINNYFVKYPFLRQPGGHLLLEEDFLEKYPACGNKLFEKWIDFERKVLQLSGETNETNSSDGEILVKFCNIVTSVQKSKRVCKTWIANSEEMKEGFILHVKSNDSFKTEIERLINRAVANKLHISPFAIIVGPDLKHITDSYICVDGIEFRVPSPKHAIDLTFKAIHALHAVYQEQSISIWLLFQKVMYGINTVWDPSCSAVEKLLKKFD